MGKFEFALLEEESDIVAASTVKIWNVAHHHLSDHPEVAWLENHVVMIVAEVDLPTYLHLKGHVNTQSYGGDGESSKWQQTNLNGTARPAKS